MKLATTTGDFSHFTDSAAQAVAAFEGTGFKHLDYNFYEVFHNGSPYLTDKWKFEVNDAGEAAARLSFDFVQAHSPDYNPLDKNTDHDAGIKATLATIEACGMLGIKNIVVHPGFCDEITYPDGRNEYFKATADFCEKLIPTIEKYGVTVCLENSCERNMGSKYFFMTGEELSSFAEKMNHPLLKCCFDVGHANLRNTSIYNDIVTLGDKLRAVHIQDNAGVWDEHIAPFYGTLDCDAVIQALLRIDYKGFFTFESSNMKIISEMSQARNLDKGITERKLDGMSSLDIQRLSVGVLYDIGKFMLQKYDCFEE